MSTSNDNTDKELQEFLEGAGGNAATGAHPYDKEDMTAYLTLFEILEQKPSVDLPLNFSDNIVAQLEARRHRVADFRWNFILPLAALIFIGISYLAVLYINAAYADIFLQMFLKFKWHVAFVAICFFVIQYLDHRLIKRSPSATKLKSV